MQPDYYLADGLYLCSFSTAVKKSGQATEEFDIQCE